MKRRDGRQAYSLVELMTYIAVLGVVTGIAYTAHYRCMMGSRSLIRNSADIIRAVKAGEKWREDIRMATVEPEASGDTLRIVLGSGEVSYRFADGNVMRKGMSESDWNVLLGGVRASRMQADARKEVSSWMWELELETGKEKVHVRPLFSFQSVPGYEMSLRTGT